MNSKLKIVVSIVTSFSLGCVMTYIVITKQKMDALFQGVQPSPNHSIKSDQSVGHNPLNPQVLSANDNAFYPPDSPSSSNNVNSSKAISTNDYTQEQAKAIIQSMPDVVLDQYIDKFMAHDASQEIANKRRFAERAVEELYQPNDNSPLTGDIRLSFNRTLPTHSVDTSTIDKNAKLYAHLDTMGQVPSSPYVFVKWVNNETGQVLLFEKKDIVENRNQNWVSFTPYEGWEEGSYDIRFYQFTSELQPIAQLTYNIYKVNDSDNE